MLKPPLRKRNRLSLVVQLIMAADKQSSLSKSVLSSLTGLLIGTFIYKLLRLLFKFITKRRNGPNINMDIEYESHTPDTPPDTPLHPLANCTRRPVLITVETIPGHAISDMDRDIKLQIANSQDLRDLEAAIPR